MIEAIPSQLEKELTLLAPTNDIERLIKLFSNITNDDEELIEHYNKLRSYDCKLRRAESKRAIIAYNIIDNILLSKYLLTSEISEWRYETVLRIIMSLAIYGIINVELKDVDKEEFINIRTNFKNWYINLKRKIK